MKAQRRKAKRRTWPHRYLEQTTALQKNDMFFTNDSFAALQNRTCQQQTTCSQNKRQRPCLNCNMPRSNQNGILTLHLTLRRECMKSLFHKQPFDTDMHECILAAKVTLYNVYMCVHRTPVSAELSLHVVGFALIFLF